LTIQKIFLPMFGFGPDCTIISEDLLSIYLANKKQVCCLAAILDA